MNSDGLLIEAEFILSVFSDGEITLQERIIMAIGISMDEYVAFCFIVLMSYI